VRACACFQDTPSSSSSRLPLLQAFVAHSSHTPRGSSCWNPRMRQPEHEACSSGELLGRERDGDGAGAKRLLEGYMTLAEREPWAGQPVTVPAVLPQAYTQGAVRLTGEPSASLHARIPSRTHWPSCKHEWRKGRASRASGRPSHTDSSQKQYWLPSCEHSRLTQAVLQTSLTASSKPARADEGIGCHMIAIPG
jgi:hypothetical protein